MEEDGCAKSYRGLPVTSAAIILPLVYIIGLWVPANVMLVVYYVLPVLVGLLFICDFRIPKIDIAKLWRKEEKIEKEAVCCSEN